MSRTIRRKNVPPSMYHDYTHDVDIEHAKLHGGWRLYEWIECYTGEKVSKWIFNDVAWGGDKEIQLKGKKYWKGWWTFHSDKLHRYGRKDRRRDWGAVRNWNNRDLDKWFKNDDHEPIFWEEVNKTNWD